MLTFWITVYWSTSGTTPPSLIKKVEAPDPAQQGRIQVRLAQAAVAQPVVLPVEQRQRISPLHLHGLVNREAPALSLERSRGVFK